VWLIYLSARTAIQHLVPALDYPTEMRQDEWITLFRFACGVAVCGLYWRCWTLDELRWKRMTTWVWLGCLLLFASHLANALNGHRPFWFDWRVVMQFFSV
jgi:hypothetical protein